MEQSSTLLGRRIVELARLATAMHLEQALGGSEANRQQANPGGAGEVRVGGDDSQALRRMRASHFTDETLPTAALDSRLPPRRPHGPPAI